VQGPHELLKIECAKLPLNRAGIGVDQQHGGAAIRAGYLYCKREDRLHRPRDETYLRPRLLPLDCRQHVIIAEQRRIMGDVKERFATQKPDAARGQRIADADRRIRVQIDMRAVG